MSSTSEALTAGHPDKLCDRIADAVLEACLASDPETVSALDACTKTGMVMLLGVVHTKATVDFEQVVREAVRSVGYDDVSKGLDYRTMNVILAAEEEEPPLLEASDRALGEECGACDGYAIAETPELLPLSHVLASRLVRQLDIVRENRTLSWVWPSGRVMVSVGSKPGSDSEGLLRVERVVIVTQHSPDVGIDQMTKDLREHVFVPVVQAQLRDERTVFQVRSASFRHNALAGTDSDTGFSGRARDADSYGGGLALTPSRPFSGRDGSKLARSGLYGARWAARTLVESHLCRRCHVQLRFMPKSTPPVVVTVNSFGTCRSPTRTDSELAQLVERAFDFRLTSLHQELGLKASWRPLQLSAYGHFGLPDVAWEKGKQLR